MRFPDRDDHRLLPGDDNYHAVAASLDIDNDIHTRHADHNALDSSLNHHHLHHPLDADYVVCHSGRYDNHELVHEHNH